MVSDGYESNATRDANGSGAPPPVDSEASPLLGSAPQPFDIRVAFAAAAVVVVTGGVGVGVASGALSADALARLASWFESRGPSAVLLYALFYFLLELVAVPAIPLTLGSGYLFGVPTGTALVSLSSTAAATAAFLISRYGLRDYISGVATKYPRFRAIDRAIGRQGFKFVLLLRLSPLLPFSVSNYLYGLTSVRLPQYVAGSWLGMLPGTVAYVSAGAALNALTDIASSKQAVNPYLLGIGLAATVGALYFIGQLAAGAIEAEGGDLNETV